MHIVCVNYTYSQSLMTPDSLLDRYETLTGWADCLTAAGARVSVVQRFRTDCVVKRNQVIYRFVRDAAWSHGSLMDWPRRMHRVIYELHPDMVHVHGLQFARQAWQLKRCMNHPVPVLLQDHANAPPRRCVNRWTLRRALRQVDAISFVSREQARSWQDAGFLGKEQSVVELMEGSSRFRLQPRLAARKRTGLAGNPICLWVGRLNANKDPLTVLGGFAKVLTTLPDACLAMVYREIDLLPSVHRWLATNPTVAARVILLGQQPHDALEAIFNSADLFLLGSHHEGSGYAVLEALACGVVPVLTDIPSFRILTGQGTVGGLWPVGDAEALSRVLTARASLLYPGTPHAVRSFFEANFSWETIGSRAMDVYRQLVAANASVQAL